MTIPLARRALRMATLVVVTFWSSAWREAPVIPVKTLLKDDSTTVPMLEVDRAPKMAPALEET